MNCSIVYYTARKTSLCEKALRRRLPELGLNLSKAVFATKREALGDALIEGFSHADMVFTVGTAICSAPAGSCWFCCPTIRSSSTPCCRVRWRIISRHYNFIKMR